MKFNKKEFTIIILIISIFTLSIIYANDQNDSILTNSQSISNQKIGWGIKRNDKHEQPDVGSSNKKILEENNGICLGNKEKKVIYLTFDQGYEAGYTPQILETLKNNEVKAAFFITAHYINTASELVQQMIDEGHIVSNHTIRHKSMPDLNDEEIKDEIMGLHQVIYEKFGYSMNTTDEAELQAAYDWLVECVETMEPEIVTDEIIDNMAQGRKALGLVYSGDATYVMSENEDMGFFLPNEGTNQWSDAMVIPANAKNPDLAHEFINFVCSYEGAYDNSSYVGYTSANAEVMAELSGEGGDYEGINAYIPRTDNERDEVFEFNEQTRKVISNLWSKVKISASNANN